MSYSGPRGWMDAETARQWACRGVWAFRYAKDAPLVPTECTVAYSSAEVMRDGDYEVGGIEDPDEHWRYIGPHPDDDAGDAQEGETFDAVIYAVAGSRRDPRALWTYDSRADADRVAARIGGRVNVIRARLRLPAVEPVETVAEVGDE